MIDYRKYPKNWLTEIRPRILKRAGEVLAIDGGIIRQPACEWCNLENHAKGKRDREGKWWSAGEIWNTMLPEEREYRFRDASPVMMEIILTIAHLDHDKENHEVADDRLAALCQKCHLNYDRKHHLAVQKQNREARKGPLLENMEVQ